METLTTAELADLLYPPELERRDVTVEEAARRRRSRLTNAAKQARRWGVQPVPGRADDGQRLWPAAEVREQIAGAPGKGNWRSGGDPELHNA